MQKEDIRKLIQETFQQILEIEILDDQIDISAIESAGTQFAKEGLDVERLNLIARSILDGKMPNITVDSMYPKGKINELTYVLSTLAVLYKQLNDTKKQNIRNFVLYSLIPKSTSSMYLNHVGQKAGIADISKKSKDNEIFDTILDVIINAVPEALNLYDAEKGANFFTFITTKVINEIKNELLAQYSVVQKGEREFYKKSSLDEPVSDEEGSETRASLLPAERKSESEERIVELLAMAVDGFIRNKLLKGKSYLWNDVYDMSTKGNNIEQMASVLEQDPRYIRKIRFEISQVVDEAIKSGELRDYILKKSEVDINNFPKIKNILQGGKFLFSTPSSIIKEYLMKLSLKRLILNEWGITKMFSKKPIENNLEIIKGDKVEYQDNKGKTQFGIFIRKTSKEPDFLMGTKEIAIIEKENGDVDNVAFDKLKKI